MGTYTIIRLKNKSNAAAKKANAELIQSLPELLNSIESQFYWLQYYLKHGLYKTDGTNPENIQASIYNTDEPPGKFQ